MAARKKCDICVKVGEYQVQGETKPEWRRVGVMMVNDDGSEFILLNRDFNPAGVPNPDHRSTVLLNMFEPRNDNQQQGRRQAPPQQQQQQRQAQQQTRPPVSNSSAPQSEYDDDIPF